MNHDPIRFCVHCQLPKPRAGFRPLMHTKNHRVVCESCFEKIREVLKKPNARAAQEFVEQGERTVGQA